MCRIHGKEEGWLLFALWTLSSHARGISLECLSLVRDESLNDDDSGEYGFLDEFTGHHGTSRVVAGTSY